MKTESEQVVLLFMAIIAILSGQLFMTILIIGFMYIWEDCKWPAFDSSDYDKKMMKGPLKPWSKGN